MGKYGKRNKISLNPLDYNLGLIGESGIGKEQPISEPVLSEDGWVKMGDLSVGDGVYTQDGSVCNITHIFPQGIKDVYKITFSDGSFTRCGLEHLWKVSTIKQRTGNNADGLDRHMIKPLSDIMLDYKKIRPNGTIVHKYAVPTCNPIQFNKKELKIDPYFMGLMLGDRGTTGNLLTFTNSEDELLEYICDYSKDYTVRDRVGCKQVSIRSSETGLKSKFDHYGLIGIGSREKFIPHDYIYSSVEDRIALLRGLINTDGSITDGVAINFSTYSEQLCEDVVELSRGLGFCAIKLWYDRTTEDSTKKYESEIEYRVRIMGDISSLNLSKKHSLKIKARRAPYTKLIVDIKKVGEEESKCIMVDNDSHLYITNDYIVTHNSTIVKETCERLVGEDSYLILSVGKEDGVDAIANAMYEEAPDWDTYDEIVEDIVENKHSDYPDLKVIVIDTVDELFRIAEPEVIRLHNKNSPDKKVKSINSAFGGYGRGEDKAIEIVLESLWKLKSVGVKFVVIGHTKARTKSDPITGEEYDVLTTNMTYKYFNSILTKLHVLGVASVDRNIEKYKTGRKINNKDEIKGAVKEEKRVINFRDDNFNIESKSRFADIVDKIEFDTDKFIEAIEDAIKSEYSKQKNAKPLDEELKNQKKLEVEKEKELAKKESDRKEKGSIQDEINDITKKLSDYIKENKVSKPPQFVELLTKMKEKGVLYNSMTTEDIDVAREYLDIIQ